MVEEIVLVLIKADEQLKELREMRFQPVHKCTPISWRFSGVALEAYLQPGLQPGK
jgi:hypothetical protein